MSALQQGTMLFEILDMEPKFVKVPIEIMDVVIKVLDVFAGFFSNMKGAAEFGKIGRYYAAESMLVMNEDGEYDAEATPSYGTDTLKDFFIKVSKEGLAGQELRRPGCFQVNDRFHFNQIAPSFFATFSKEVLRFLTLARVPRLQCAHRRNLKRSPHFCVPLCVRYAPDVEGVGETPGGALPYKV